MKGAVVVSTSYTALAVIRSLGRKGIPVWIIDNKKSPCRYSCYVHRCIDFPNSYDELINLLIKLSQENKLQGWSLFADSDKITSAIARHFELLSSYYKLTTAKWDVLQFAIDKSKTYKLANEIGVPYPKTYCPASEADIKMINGPYPMLVKPSWHLDEDFFSTSRAWMVNNQNELLALFNKVSQISKFSKFLIQELIPVSFGTQISYAALCENGEVLADIFAERIRLSSEFGVSVYVRSRNIINDIDVYAQQWLAKIGYSGLAEMEFMYDERDGCYKLIDVNPRPWGWIGLCVYAGVDFPYMSWMLSQGMNLNQRLRGQGNIFWSRTVFDVISTFRMRRRYPISVLDFIKSLVRAKHEMLVKDDLLPFLNESWVLLAKKFRKSLGL